MIIKGLLDFGSDTNYLVTHRNTFPVPMPVTQILFGLYDSAQAARMIGVTPEHLRVIRSRTGQPHAIEVGRERLYRGVDVLAAALKRRASA